MAGALKSTTEIWKIYDEESSNGSLRALLESASIFDTKECLIDAFGR